jgi:hypothetical protein
LRLRRLTPVISSFSPRINCTDIVTGFSVRGGYYFTTRAILEIFTQKTEAKTEQKYSSGKAKKLYPVKIILNFHMSYSQ